MADLVIFGAGDIARIARFYFNSDSDHQVVAFAVDRDYRRSDRLFDLPVVDFEDVTTLFPASQYGMFVALSYAQMNQVRAEKFRHAAALGYRLESYVSSKCSFLTEHAVGRNCFILEDNTVQPFVKIGDNVTLWSGNHIGHDSTIEDHCFISSHVVVSGNCRIGAYSFLGVNSTIHNSITVAERSLIGAGAVIVENTVEKGVYVPERTKLLSKTSDEVGL